MIRHIRSQLLEDQQNICQDQEEAQQLELEHYLDLSLLSNQNFPLTFIQKFILQQRVPNQKEHTAMHIRIK